MDAQEELRAAVRSLVVDAPVSQAEIARRLGLSQKHLSGMLTGRATLTLGWASRIVGVVGYSLRIEVVAGPEAREALLLRALRG